jgi:lysyl-tRNA synthetase class 2
MTDDRFAIPRPLAPMIKARAELLRATRAFFDQRGFFEVQTPCLSADCVIDTYIDPITVAGAELQLPSGVARDRYFLQSSPESAMKRMLVAGAPSIYSIGPVFRAGESAALHNIEFTMLEWYHLDAGFDEEISLVKSFACERLGSDACDVITYRHAFEQYLGLHPLDEPIQRLAERVEGLDRDLAKQLAGDRDGLLDVLLCEHIQPHLGTERPMVLRDYPATQAALARVLEDDPRFAARFELYYRGIELANGYDELLDADELVRRARENNEKRLRVGRASLPVETHLTRAMREGMPKCSGVALGLDRLFMLMTGATTLDQVMPLTIMRA